MKEKKQVLKFIIKCIAIPAAAVFVIYLLNRPYKQIDDEKYMDFWDLRMLGNQIQPEQIDFANVGSSHGAYNFNYAKLEEQDKTCFNFGHASQTYAYDLALLKEYHEYLDEGCLLFIPVSYFSFNNETVNESEAQALSIKYYHFLSPKNVPDYDLYTDIVTTKLPILSAGTDILKLFPDLNLTLKVQAAEGEDNGINVEEFASRAQQRYDRHFNNKDAYFLPERIEELHEIISYCEEHEIIPILITTPFSQYYTDLVSDEFMQEFQSVVDGVIDDTGVSYYDYSHDERFQSHLEYFSDADHLNEEGQQYFMEVLMEDVTELQEALN